jgi:hypothetical protein
MNIEIPQKCWNQFFAKLNAQDDVRIDIRVQTETGMRLVAQGAPLFSVAFEVGDACNNSLNLEFGPARERALQYRVVDPIRLILRKEGAGDHFNLLEIPAESGTTVIDLHPGVSPALLDELELPG